MHAGDVVLIDEQLRGDLNFAVHLLDVDDGSIAESALGTEAFAAFEFHLCFGLATTAQQKEGSANNDDASTNNNGIEKTKRHGHFEITPRSSIGASDGHPRFVAGSS